MTLNSRMSPQCHKCHSQDGQEHVMKSQDANLTETAIMAGLPSVVCKKLSVAAAIESPC